MKLFWPVLSGVLCTAHISFAEPRVTYNAYGMPGLVDMPSAKAVLGFETHFGLDDMCRSSWNWIETQARS